MSFTFSGVHLNMRVPIVDGCRLYVCDSRMQVFEYFDKEVTKANGYQVKEAYSVSQDLLAVLDGKS